MKILQILRFLPKRINMKCGDNKQFKIRMSKKKYKHGPLINLEERSGAMDE